MINLGSSLIDMGMKRLCGYKYRIYPTDEQQGCLRQQLGNCRFLWNKLVEINSKHYELTKKFLWYSNLNVEIDRLKEEYEFLQLSNSQSLQQTAIHLDNALKAIKTGKGFPRFKKKSVTESFQVPQHFKFKRKHIFIPKTAAKLKDRWIRMIKHQPMIGTPKSVTVSLDVDQWFVSILCEIEIPDPKPSTKPAIGIDLGLNHFLTDSNGTKIDNPRFLKKQLKKLRREQRKLSRRTKGSNNRNKQKVKVAKVHRKVRRQRQDFLHQVSTELIAKAGMVCVEDLSVKGMVRTNLSKSIADVGWGQFVQYLTYKGFWNGVKIQVIDRWFPSSKLCSRCGTINRSLALKDRIYQCDCNEINKTQPLDRDHNAAINILNEGIRLSTVGTTGIHACGDTSVGEVSLRKRLASRQVSKKQEKTLASRSN